ncbi:hypothetical protein AUP68_06720 [Ilyonectria robusta]
MERLYDMGGFSSSHDEREFDELTLYASDGNDLRVQSCFVIIYFVPSLFSGEASFDFLFLHVCIFAFFRFIDSLEFVLLGISTPLRVQGDEVFVDGGGNHTESPIAADDGARAAFLCRILDEIPVGSIDDHDIFHTYRWSGSIAS